MSAAAHPARSRAGLEARYDALWDASAPLVAAGRATLDEWVGRKADDARRGLTLHARPGPAVAAALDALLGELRALEPAQHYQPPADMHLTVLAPFTATADHAPHLAQLDAYRAAIAESVDGMPPFEVDFVGVTLSTGAVLARGFPRDDTLERIRDRLRAAITARGLGAALDQRYRLETAHATLARFTEPLAHPARFVAALDAARARPFGTAVVRELELVFGDWYHSSEGLRTLSTYALKDRAGRASV